MIWLKRFFGGLFALILFGSLVSLASSIATQRTFGNPTQIKTWLVQSHIYDKLVNSALDVAQKDNTDSGADGSIELTNQKVKEAANAAFTPEVLQQSAEEFINASYDWLNGKTSTPQFKIDLTNAKQTYADKVGQYVTQRLSKLTVCTAEQQAKLQIPVDSLTITCRPASLDPKAEGQRVTNEIMKSAFLTNPVITQDTFARNTNDPKSSPYYQAISQAPLLYKISKYAPFVFGGLILISSAIVIFAAPNRRKGWRRVGTITLSAGIVLVVSKFTTEFSVNKLKELQPDTALINQLKQPSDYLIEKVTGVYWDTFLILGGIFIFLGILILLINWLANRDKKHDKKQSQKDDKDDLPPDASTNPLLSSDDEKVTNPFDNKPSEPTDASTPSGPPVIGGGGTTADGKKRPPLIQ